MATLYTSANTLLWIPYNALAIELSEDYDERTEIMAYREAFAILGTLHALGLPPLLESFKGWSVRYRWFVYAASMAFMSILLPSLMIALLPNTTNRRETSREKMGVGGEQKIVPSLMNLMRNKVCLLSSLSLSFCLPSTNHPN